MHDLFLKSKINEKLIPNVTSIIDKLEKNEREYKKIKQK